MQTRLRQLLATLRSYDSVQRLYFELHSRSLNAQRTREVTACFRQGTYYLNSARESDLSVKPIIVYYAILSLSRGMTLLLDAGKNEESLSPQHGLETIGWRRVLYKDGDIGALKARIRSGTFNELVSSTNNIVIARSKRFPAPSTIDVKIIVKPPSIGQELSFDDLLSRIVYLHDIFIHATGKTPNHFPAAVWISERACDIHPDGLDTAPYKEEILDRIRRGFSRHQTHIGKSVRILIQLDQLDVPIVGDRVIIPFDDGSCLSNILLGFAASYMISMLARYYPTRWISLITNEKGDAYAPVLETLVEYLGEQFPEEMIEYLLFLLQGVVRL